jgi:hypothetical protein
MPQQKKKIKKSTIAHGLEHMMNNSQINPFTPDGSRAFSQMTKASNMPMSEMLRYVGHRAKNPEQERIENRMQNLQ